MLHRLALLALLAALLLSAGCGGDSGGAVSTSTLAAHPPRAVPPGVTITHTETGTAREAGEGMPPLRTFAAAKQECGWFHAAYLAKVYGGVSTDWQSISEHFATHRAAPGYVGVIRRGCRAGMHV
jgi:hypothetical protein